jgi:hypothetical protein
LIDSIATIVLFRCPKTSTSEGYDQQIEAPCSPISQILDMPTLVLIEQADDTLQRELPTAGKDESVSISLSSGGFPSGLNATGLAISK